MEEERPQILIPFIQELYCNYFHISKTQRFNREDEQLKTALHPTNYQAQRNHQAQLYQPPRHYERPTEMPPQQTFHHPPPPNYQRRPPYQPAAGGQHQPVNHQQSRSNFSPTDISFLAKTIRDLLSNDLGKEIAEIKQRLNNQIPNQSAPNPQVINAQTQPQPNLYSLQMIPHPP